MKRTFSILLCMLLLLGLLAGCGGERETSAQTPGPDPVPTEEPTPEPTPEPEATARFTERDSDILISPDGTEYTFLANEGILDWLGELAFVAYVEGEPEKDFMSMQTGVFSIEADPTDHLLIRKWPDSEWNSIYRKASLPDFAFSIENCSRLEFIPYTEMRSANDKHVRCGAGITDPAEIAEFLSTVRAQKSAEEADLYRFVGKPGGPYTNCYLAGAVFGFFEEEPYLAVRLMVTSYNDMAYSVYLDGVYHVLPEEWFLRLQGDSPPALRGTTSPAG